MDINDFVINIIANGDEEEQIDFLKVYPALKDAKKFSIIAKWFSVYDNKENDTDDVKKNNAILFMKNGLRYGYLYLEPKLHVEIINLIEDNPENITQLKMDLLRTHNTNKCKHRSFLEQRSHIHKPNFSKTQKLKQIESIFDISVKDFVTVFNGKYIALFNNINVHRLIDNVLHSRTHYTIKYVVYLFNRISNMVVCEILIRAANDGSRLNMIRKFLDIIKMFISVNNYEAAFAVISGLNNNSIQRIKSLWIKEKKHTQRFAKYSNLISHHNGYICYRDAIKNKEKYIPFLAIILSDIDHCLQVKLYDKKKDCVNKDTYHVLVKMINQFKNSIPSPETIDMPVRWYNRILKFIYLYEIVDEDTLYDKSLKIHPKSNSMIYNKDSSDQISDSTDEKITYQSRNIKDDIDDDSNCKSFSDDSWTELGTESNTETDTEIDIHTDTDVDTDTGSEFNDLPNIQPTLHTTIESDNVKNKQFMKRFSSSINFSVKKTDTEKDKIQNKNKTTETRDVLSNYGLGEAKPVSFFGRFDRKQKKLSKSSLKMNSSDVISE